MANLYFFFLKRFYLFLEGKGETDRQTSSSCLLYAPWLGTEPTAQACALTKNPTSDLLLLRTMPNQLSHTGQGQSLLVQRS